eukprot:272327_1
MRYMVYTLLIWRVIPWKPSYITGSITCDTIVTGTIEMFEHHFYSLRINYDLNITLSNCESSFDTQMTIFDSHHNQISSNYCDGDDCGDQTSSKCELFTMSLRSGIYYISINGFSSDFGTYVIQTTCTSQQSNKMLTIPGAFICTQLLLHNIDIIYGVDYNACVYEHCLSRPACAMVNYVNNFKSASDSRCYLFDTECDVIHINTDRYDTQIALKVSSTTQCNDLYHDWMDSLGDTCTHYESFGWCSDGMMHSNLTIHDTTHGLTAHDVCCACGGGVYVVYDVGMKLIYSTDILTSLEMRGRENNPKQTKRLNKLNLYRICIMMLRKHIDCMMMMGTNNVSLVACDLSDEFDTIDTNVSLNFILMIGMYDDGDDKSAIYLNTNWFDIDLDDDATLGYDDCVDELWYASYNQLYAIVQYDIPATNVNISFANTTMPYTTDRSSEHTTVSDIPDDGQSGNVIEFLKSNQLVVIVLAGFVFLFVLIVLFMIWFCRNSHKKEKQNKIEFSKLKSDVMTEMDRRCSMVSFEGYTGRDMDDEEEKIAIINDEDTYTASDNNRCLLCYDRRANTVFLPCGHVSYCNDCVQSSIDNDRRCPQCRQKITDWKQIFRGGFRL